MHKALRIQHFFLLSFAFAFGACQPNPLSGERSIKKVNKAPHIGQPQFNILHFMKFIFYFQVLVFVNEKE